MFNNFYRNKKILVTGHTGFKGSWLCLWLSLMGAKIYGISDNKSALFNLIVDKKVKSSFIDIRNLNKLKKRINQIKPDIIFHLAAQALVGESYKDPIKTWTTNLIGTINLLEAIRNFKKKCTVIIITSDKAYKNIEQKKGYIETDILHGSDPYSASKSCADIAVQSYVNTVINNQNIKFGIARAGNVIGGGDFSNDRIIPDFVKSIENRTYLKIRNKSSTRPWQHVLEPLGGYLIFAIKMSAIKKNKIEILNFGPKKINNYSVGDVINTLVKILPYNKIQTNVQKKFKESKLLKLNSNKATKFLKWKPTLNFKETISLTGLWYKFYLSRNNSSDIRNFTIQQINQYYKKFKNINKHG